MNFHINVISRCIVEIFRSSWLIAKEELVIFKINRAVTWTCVHSWCAKFFFSFFYNCSIIVWFNLEWHVSCQPAWCLSSILLQYHHHRLMSISNGMWPSWLKLVSYSARGLYPLSTDNLLFLTAYGHCNPVPFSWQRIQRSRFILPVILIHFIVGVSTSTSIIIIMSLCHYIQPKSTWRLIYINMLW